MLESLQRWQINRKTCRIKVKKSQIFDKIKILQENNITDRGGIRCPPPSRRAGAAVHADGGGSHLHQGEAQGGARHRDGRFRPRASARRGRVPKSLSESSGDTPSNPTPI